MSPAGWSWRSRKLRHCLTSKSRRALSTRSTTRDAAWRSTISALVTPPGGISRLCRSTPSRSTVRLCETWQIATKGAFFCGICSVGSALSAALPWPKGWRTPPTRRSRGQKGSAICRVTIWVHRPSSALGSVRHRPVSRMAGGGPAQIMEGERRSKPWSGVRIGLTGRILILVIFAVVPALVIQAWNEYDLRIAREADIRQQVVQTTKQFGEEIGELREGARQLLLALAQLNTVRTRQPGACSPLFAKLKARFANYGLLGAADTSGRILCTSEPTSYSSVAEQPFFERAMAQPGLAVGNYWVDPANGQRMIHFAERFEDDDGVIAGVVFAGLDLAWLSDHLKERGLAPTASILIADREGNIIARLPHPELLVGKNMRKSHEAIMDGEQPGWEETVGVDGTTRIFGYVPPALPSKDFFLSAGQSKAEAFAAIDSATRRGIALILAGLLAAVYAAWAGGRNFIRRPIQDLLKVTAEWRNWNYAARAHLEDRSSEIGR